MSNEIRKNSISHKIFSAIRSFMEGSNEYFNEIGRPTLKALMSRKTFGQTFAAMNGYSYNEDNEFRNRYHQALKRFEIKKFIRFTDEDNFVLTDSGRGVLLKFEIDDISLPVFYPKKWDRIWRVLIFDIPEITRSVRNIFRNKLQEFDFYTLQKSVYVTPQDCEKEIMELAKMLRIDRNVNIIKAKSLGQQEKSVKKFFGLV